MKKWLLSFLFLFLVVFLVACNDKEEVKTEDEKEVTTATASEQQVKEEAELEPEVTKPEKVTIQAPSGISIAAPLYKLNLDKLLASGADEVEFLSWNSPDELRARIISGQAQVSAVPTYVGANLYNKDVDVQLLNTLIWGILYGLDQMEKRSLGKI